MKNIFSAILGVLMMASVSLVATKTAMAQDPAKVAPNTYKVLLDTDRVRVLEARLAPGDKTAAHFHPANVIYAFADSKAKFTPAGRKPVVATLKAGSVTWSAPETHVSENVGSSEAHVLIFEIKKLGKRGKAVSGADPVKVDPGHFKVRLNNASVRVLEFTAKPGDKFPMHTHPDYVAYTFSGGKTTYSFPDGKTAEREATPGTATWNESEAHAGQIGNTETHTLLVELKASAAKAKK